MKHLLGIVALSSALSAAVELRLADAGVTMEWERWANYGLPMLLLAVMVYALWKTASWAKDHVVVPIVKSHLDLIDVLKREIPKQSDRLEEVAEKLSGVSENITDKLNHVADVQAKTIGKQVKQMAELKEAVEQNTDIISNKLDYQTQVIEDKGSDSDTKIPKVPRQ